MLLRLHIFGQSMPRQGRLGPLKLVVTLLVTLTVTLSPSVLNAQGSQIPSVGDVQVYEGPTLGMRWEPLTGINSLPSPNGGLLFNNNGSAGVFGYNPQAFSLNQNGQFDLSSQAACFNLGPWNGDLIGTACSPPALAPGAASRSVGALGGGLAGVLPNPTLVPSAVVGALGTPGGDLGGTNYATPLVMGLASYPICSGMPPPAGSALIWGGTCYAPQVQSPGINSTTGDMICGPGSGTQPCTMPTGVVTNAKLAATAAQTIKGNPSTSIGTPVDVPLAAGLTFNNGALQLSPTGVTAQQITVGSNCWAIGLDGRINNIGAGSCSSGSNLTADDGATNLTADDGVTVITADGGSGIAGCTAIALKENIACNAVASAF